MMTGQRMAQLESVFRIAIGTLFLGAGIGKIIQPYDFLGTVYSYSLVGPFVGYLIAFVLPWLEVVLGVCLLAKLLENGVYLVCVWLLTIFLFAKVSAIHRELQIGCGCVVYSSGEIVGIGDVLMVFTCLILAIAGWRLSWLVESRANDF